MLAFCISEPPQSPPELLPQAQHPPAIVTVVPLLHVPYFCPPRGWNWNSPRTPPHHKEAVYSSVLPSQVWAKHPTGIKARRAAAASSCSNRCWTTAGRESECLELAFHLSSALRLKFGWPKGPVSFPHVGTCCLSCQPHTPEDKHSWWRRTWGSVPAASSPSHCSHSTGPATASPNGCYNSYVLDLRLYCRNKGNHCLKNKQKGVMTQQVMTPHFATATLDKPVDSVTQLFCQQRN